MRRSKSYRTCDDEMIGQFEVSMYREKKPRKKPRYRCASDGSKVWKLERDLMLVMVSVKFFESIFKRKARW